MCSTPAASTTSASPQRDGLRARRRSPAARDAHALLIVYAGPASGTPAKCATCRAHVGAVAGLARVADDRLVDLRRRDAGASHRLAGDVRAQVGDVHARQRAAEAADRRADGAGDDDFAAAAVQALSSLRSTHTDFVWR